MVHHQEANLGLLGFVLCETKTGDFDLLEQRVIPGGPGGGRGRWILKGASGVLRGCGWFFLEILHDIVSPVDGSAKEYRKQDAHQPGRNGGQARALRGRWVE